MPPRRRSMPAALVAAGLLVGVLSGCTGADARDRAPGDAITQEEAATLAGLLQRNQQRGGAGFVVTAPYGREAVLTLTGAVDYRRAEGRAQSVTRVGDGDERTAAVFFTAEELWFGELPGLAEALAADGAEGAEFLRRPTAAVEDGTADLVDVLVAAVLNLSASRADAPESYLDGWTWQGQRSIDSRLCSLFAGPDGGTVAVDAADSLLLQYVTTLDGDIEITVTLAGHGRQDVELPTGAVSAAAADHPEIAEALGI